MSDSEIKIVMVDDDNIALTTIIEHTKIFKERFSLNIEYKSYNNVSDFLTAFESNSIDFEIAILDYMMPKKTGIELSKVIKKKKTDAKIMLVSGFDSDKTSKLAIDNNIDEYMIKPPEINDFHFKLYRIYRELLLEKKLSSTEKRAKLLSGVKQFKTQNKKMMEIIDNIPALSESDITILIRGESGTGKELIARMIHDLSNRKNNAFIPLNCSALPENLLESELFGYVKGAFTGANKSYPGIFRLAKEGSVFLDEIGDMPIGDQAKLLRFLENKEVRSIGDSKTEKVNTRIIAATNRDLEKDVEKSLFRKDLYFRLQTIEIHIPPLRERPEDIEYLANYFIEIFSAKYNKQLMGISRDVINDMKNYSWPGNVRELRSKIEQAYILTTNSCIKKLDINENMQFTSKDTAKDINKKDVKLQNEKIIAYSSAKEIFEKNYIKALLGSCKGNIRQASTVSKRDRKWVYNQLEKYKIDPDSFR